MMDAAPQPVPKALLLLGAVALLPYGVLLLAWFGPQLRGDAVAGEAFRLLLIMVLLWLLLGMMLFLGHAGGAMPRCIAWLAWIVVPLSPPALLLADDAAATRPIAHAGIVLLPLLFALYALWARLASWQRRIPPGAAAALAWGPAGAITLLGLAAAFR